ncbi:MAG TPA: hypothetical protein VF647_09325 [Longimicrobium sp.]|jgi:hypothetical protein
MPISSRPAAWRMLFLISGLMMVPGALTHPRGGGMPVMLADPGWISSHLLMLGGHVALVAGLLALGQRTSWLRVGVVVAALQVVEAAFHAAAFVDAHHLQAGRPTPVLSTHMLLTPLVYPLFALGMIWVIVAAARAGALGSGWIAPLGVAGVAAHGAAAIVVGVLGHDELGPLFAGIALFGLWCVFASLWPVRARSSAAAPVPVALATTSVPASGGFGSGV